MIYDFGMTYGKKSLAAGLLIGLAAAGAVIYQYPAFSQVAPHGLLWFGLCLVLVLLSCAALILRPDPNTAALPAEGAPEKKSILFRPALYRIWVWFVFFLAPFLGIAAVERMNGNFLWELKDPFFISDNYLVALLLYLLVFALCGSIRGTILTLNPLLFAFGAGNMYVKAFKGSPLLPMDAGNVATAAKVAGGYEYSVGFEITFALVLTLFIMCLAVHLRMPSRMIAAKPTSDQQNTNIKAAEGESNTNAPAQQRKYSKKWHRRERKARFVALLVMALFVGLFYGTDLPVKRNLRPDFFNQTRGYEGRGALLQFVYNTRYMVYLAPSHYDPSKVEDLLYARINQAATDEEVVAPDTANTPVPTILETNNIPAPAQGQTPDIIVVMNESFADLSVLGDFETDTPVLPNLTSLSENTIRGTASVSVRGTGTSNTEFEFLTGDSMAFLPAGSNAYQLYVSDEQPGLVSTLQSQGYVSEASHPYFAANWNRPDVYRAMGFSRYLAMEDMFPEELGDGYLEGNGDRATFSREVAKAYPDELILLDGYVSDHYGCQKLIEAYEARDANRPYFHFHITMQNHSPYRAMYSPNFSGKVHLVGTEQTYYEAERYLTRLQESDRALGELLDYFAGQSRPTLVLFFGDHQPIVEDDFLAEIAGKPLDQWTDEEEQARYQVPFVIWANYDIPEGTIDRISVNYLSTLLQQVAGLPQTPYNRYLSRLYTRYPVISAQGCYDSEGTFLAAEQTKEYPEGDPRNLSDYERIIYNNLKDAAHRADDIFELAE